MARDRLRPLHWTGCDQTRDLGRHPGLQLEVLIRAPERVALPPPRPRVLVGQALCLGPVKRGILNEDPLSLVALARPAEPHHHRRPSTVRLSPLAEYIDEPDYSWKPVRDAKDLMLSHQLSPRAHRPGPDAMWDEFDAAVLRLGLAMESESIAEVQAATEVLSVTMSRLADRLDGEIGPYPWYKSHGSEPAAPQRTEPVDDTSGAEASVS